MGFFLFHPRGDLLNTVREPVAQRWPCQPHLVADKGIQHRGGVHVGKTGKLR